VLAEANESSESCSRFTEDEKQAYHSFIFVIIYEGTVASTTRHTYLLISAVKFDEFEALKKARKLRFVVERILTKSPSRKFRD